MKRIWLSHFAVLVITAIALQLQFSSSALAQGTVYGTYRGSMSGLDVRVELFEKHGEPNGTIWFNGERENLSFLGYKPSIQGLYFWRPADKAAICIYRENGVAYMTYFEKDNVRKVVLR